MKKPSFLSCCELTNSFKSQIEISGKTVTRDTFKKNVDLESFNKIEKSLGFSQKNLAKNNQDIIYWKCNFPELSCVSWIYQLSGNIYIFVSQK